MDLSKLLNDPRPPKRPRMFALPPGHSASDDTDSTAEQAWQTQLPVDMVGYVMTFLTDREKREYRLVNQTWYAAYNRYHIHVAYIQSNIFDNTPNQLIAIFHMHGFRLRSIIVTNLMLFNLVRMDPHLSTRVIPNVVSAGIICCDPSFPSKTWLLDACQGWKKLLALHYVGYDFEVDADFTSNLNKLLCSLDSLRLLTLDGISLQPSGFLDRDLLASEPSYSVMISRLSILKLSVQHYSSAEDIQALLESLCHIEGLMLEDVNDLRVLDAIVARIEQRDHLPKIKRLHMNTGLDLVRTPAVTVRETVVVEQAVNENEIVTAAAAIEQQTIIITRKITVIGTMNRLRDLARPDLQLGVGFVLGACSCPTTHPHFQNFINNERQFLNEFSTKCIPRIIELKLTHYTPSVPGGYWPLSALFHGNTVFPQLEKLELYLTPLAWFKESLAQIINNHRMLPNLTDVKIYHDEASDIDLDAFKNEGIDNRNGALSVYAECDDLFSSNRGDIESGTFDWDHVRDVLNEINSQAETTGAELIATY